MWFIANKSLSNNLVISGLSSDDLLILNRSFRLKKIGWIDRMNYLMIKDKHACCLLLIGYPLQTRAPLSRISHLQALQALTLESKSGCSHGCASSSRRRSTLNFSGSWSGRWDLRQLVQRPAPFPQKLALHKIDIVLHSWAKWFLESRLHTSSWPKPSIQMKSTLLKPPVVQRETKKL